MDEGEQVELYRRIMGWLRRRVRRRGLDHLEDDLLGAAGLSFALALRAWRPHRGPLSPLAWRYVKQGTLGLLGRETRRGAVTVSVETVEIEEPYEEPRLPSMMLLDPNDPDHRLAWSHLVEGASIRKIAETHGLSVRGAREKLQLALGRLDRTLDAASVDSDAPDRPNKDRPKPSGRRGATGPGPKARARRSVCGTLGR